MQFHTSSVFAKENSNLYSKSELAYYDMIASCMTFASWSDAVAYLRGWTSSPGPNLYSLGECSSIKFIELQQNSDEDLVF